MCTVNAKKWIGGLAVVCTLVLYGFGAIAQPPAGDPGGGPGGGPGGPPKSDPKAWGAEARAVAKDLGLSAELTTRLVDAYATAREAQSSAFRPPRPGQPGERPDPSQRMERMKAAKAELETAIKGVLSAEQAEKALPALSAFNHRTDSLVTALNGLGLDENAMAAAMRLVRRVTPLTR